MARICSTAETIASEPLSPALMGTTTWMAAPSLAGIGPTTWPPLVPPPAKRRTSPAPLAWAAAPAAPPRSYTTSAGTVPLGVNRLARSTTRVDSAPLGRASAGSFFSTSFNLPASGPPTTNTTSHAARTAHFVQRPHGNLAMLRMLFTPLARLGWVRRRRREADHLVAAQRLQERLKAAQDDAAQGRAVNLHLADSRGAPDRSDARGAAETDLHPLHR